MVDREFGLDNQDPLYTMNEIPMRESRAKEDLRLVRIMELALNCSIVF